MYVFTFLYFLNKICPNLWLNKLVTVSYIFLCDTCKCSLQEQGIFAHGRF